MKTTDSLAKVFGKVLLFSFVVVLAINLAEVYLRPLLPKIPHSPFTNKIGDSLVVVTLLCIVLYVRFFGRRSATPKVEPTQVVKIRVEVGGMVKLKNHDTTVDHIEEVEKWLSENIKLSQVPALIEKGELQFTEAGNDYDLLVDFIELEDGSGQVLQTLMVEKGSSKQIEFIQKLGNRKLEWRCDHINVN